ncbi:MAG: cysteine desulfurase family protein [Cyclobacteriaceae bacterium]
MPNNPIYFDYAATTPTDSRVLKEMLPYFSQIYGNAASSTHLQGADAKKAVKRAQNQIAELISAEPKEIYFTSGSTESINLAIKGVFELSNKKERHIITVKTEHKAVLDTCNYLEGLGADVTYLDVDSDGLIDLDELENSITEATILVSVMYANNETGVLQDIKAIGEICKKRNVLFFSDATQAFGKVDLNVTNMPIDILCFSGHKIYGPKGVGGLYIRKGVSPAMQIHGGGHQNQMRSGTLNVPGIVGLGKASEVAFQNMESEYVRLKKLRDDFEENLIHEKKIKVNGSKGNRLPNISNIQMIGIEADEFILRNRFKISVATGSACNSEVIEPSHVLKAMGLSDKKAGTSMRVSLGMNTTMSEIETLLSLISN